MRKLLTALTLITILAIAVVPALAQTAHTKTVTETEINDSFRVNNPIRIRVSDLSVDLQPGQVVVTATVNRRNADPNVVVTTYVPNISNGRIYWSVTAKLVNGEPVSQELLDQINASMSSSWRNYIKRNLPAGRVTAFEITEDAVTVTYTTPR
jgi:hypothetical protein